MTEESFDERLERRKQDNWSVAGDSWQKVGEDMLQAIEEVAADLGGEELSAKACALGLEAFPVPSAEALCLLENLSPGSAIRVMERARELQDSRIQRERKELKKELRKEVGRQVLRNFGILK